MDKNQIHHKAIRFARPPSQDTVPCQMSTWFLLSCIVFGE